MSHNEIFINENHSFVINTKLSVKQKEDVP